MTKHFPSDINNPRCFDNHNSWRYGMKSAMDGGDIFVAFEKPLTTVVNLGFQERNAYSHQPCAAAIVLEIHFRRHRD